MEIEYGTKKIGDSVFIILKYPKYGKDKYQIQDKTKNNLTLDNIYDNGVHELIEGKSGRILMIEKTTFDNLSKTTLYSTRWVIGGKWYKYLIPYFKNYKITTGVLTVPFKLRPKIDSTNFSLSTDATLGPYIGITKRISKRNPYYVTIPATLGLSFVNINENTTSLERTENNLDVIPGISWSSGLIFQFDSFNIGFTLGQDYASGIGDNWIYQGATWYSFAIGYSFLKDDTK